METSHGNAAPAVEIGRFLTGLVQQNDQGDELAREQVKETRAVLAELRKQTEDLRRTADAMARGQPVIVGAGLGSNY